MQPSTGSVWVAPGHARRARSAASLAAGKSRRAWPGSTRAKKNGAGVIRRRFSSALPLVRDAQVGSRLAVPMVTAHHTQATPGTQPGTEVHARAGIQLVTVARHAGLQHCIIKGHTIAGAIAVPVGRQVRADRSTGGAVAFAQAAYHGVAGFRVAVGVGIGVDQLQVPAAGVATAQSRNTCTARP